MKDRLSHEQLEAVLRRAAELQEESERSLDRADVVRIARELGIEARHVEAALEEARVQGRGDPYVKVAWVLAALAFGLILLGIFRHVRDLIS